MSLLVLTIADDATLVATIRLMFQQRIKRLPVIDQEGKLVGIIDRQSILQALVQ